MRIEIAKQRLDHWLEVYENLMGAYKALSEGGVKYYMIEDRQLTRYDLDMIGKEMREAEQKIDYYDGLVNGTGRPRRAFAVIPRDW